MILWCDKKSLDGSVSVETMLVTKHIPARNCISSNWIVGCMRVVDGIVLSTSRDRIKLFCLLSEYNIKNIKAKPAKRIYIPKKNGKKRPLGIPIIKDRIFQNVVKNALDHNGKLNLNLLHMDLDRKEAQ